MLVKWPHEVGPNQWRYGRLHYDPRDDHFATVLWVTPLDAIHKDFTKDTRLLHEVHPLEALSLEAP